MKGKREIDRAERWDLLITVTKGSFGLDLIISCK